MINQEHQLQPSGQLQVCLVVMYFTIGGLERVVVRLANGLATRGIPTRVIIVETGKRNALVTELDEHVELICLEGSVLKKLCDLRRLTRGYITHLQFGDGYVHPLCRLALSGHKSLVITYQSVYSHLRNIIQTKLDFAMSGQFKTVIAVSERVKEYCVQSIGISESKIQVIYNAIDVRSNTDWQDWSNRPLELVCVASLYKHKNQATLLHGVATAHQMGCQVRLSLVGDGPDMARLFKLACDLNIRSSITWYGAIWRREDVQAIVDRADVFVTASKWEGFSIALLEAMASGKPIIASDIQPHREALDENALFFPPEDPSALAKAIVKLHKDSSLGHQLGSQGYLRTQLFNTKDFIDRHIEVYNTYLNVQ